MNHLFAQNEQQRGKGITAEDSSENSDLVQSTSEQSIDTTLARLSTTHTTANILTNNIKVTEDTENHSKEQLIIDELQIIAKSCLFEQSKPSLSMIRLKLEQLGQNIQIVPDHTKRESS